MAHSVTVKFEFRNVSFAPFALCSLRIAGSLRDLGVSAMNHLSLLIVLLVLFTWLFPLWQPETRAQEETVASLEIGSATVGRPTEIRWRLAKQGTGEPVAARLGLTITHIEKDKKIFALEGISTEGDFTFLFHFADGSDHRVDIVAQPDGGKPIREEKVVPVTAVDPPAGAFLPLILFLAVIALGLIAGRRSKRASRGDGARKDAKDAKFENEGLER